MNYSLTKVSSNPKTGPIPVTYSPKQNCPDTCPLKANGCYAEGGPVNIHWMKLSKGDRGVSFDTLIQEISSLPNRTLWRHDVAGDLAHDNGTIDRDHVRALTKANRKGKKAGFTYTHHVPNKENIETLEEANAGGFTINLSADTAAEAAALTKTGLPVVTLLPMDAPNSQTVEGTRVVACPAETKNLTCSTCGLCAKADRDYVIGFRAHGTSKKKVNVIASAA